MRADLSLAQLLANPCRLRLRLCERVYNSSPQRTVYTWRSLFHLECYMLQELVPYHRGAFLCVCVCDFLYQKTLRKRNTCVNLGLFIHTPRLHQYQKTVNMNMEQIFNGLCHTKLGEYVWWRRGESTDQLMVECDVDQFPLDISASLQWRHK